jgi:isopenicillin-N N-acyltransferase-like protein
VTQQGTDLAKRLKRAPGEEFLVQNISDLPVLVLEGSPRERGRVLGESRKATIRKFIDEWKDRFQKSTGANPEKYIEEFITETELVAAAERWTPNLVEETKGIAQGCGLEFETVFAMQIPDEERWFRAEKRPGSTQRESKGCSALGVFGQSGIPPLLAQTLDVGSSYDEYQVLLHIKDPASRVKVLVFTMAGFIPAHGVNNHGIGMCCNALFQMNHAVDGLPVSFVYRGILAQATLVDAVAFVSEIKHATGQNYMIGGPEKIVSYECSANQVSQYLPAAGATRIFHTNHPLVNNDVRTENDASESRPAKATPTSGTPSNSETRLRALENRLGDPAVAVTVETVKAALGSHDSSVHPVCRHKKPGGGAITAGCQIAVLSIPPELHLAPGPPCSTEFGVFTF